MFRLLQCLIPLICAFFPISKTDVAHLIWRKRIVLNEASAFMFAQLKTELRKTCVE